LKDSICVVYKSKTILLLLKKSSLHIHVPVLVDICGYLSIVQTKAPSLFMPVLVFGTDKDGALL
jgi:hypothetical protein